MNAKHSAVIILSRGRERGAEGQTSKQVFHGPYKFALGVGGHQKDFVGAKDSGETFSAWGEYVCASAERVDPN